MKRLGDDLLMGVIDPADERCDVRPLHGRYVDPDGDLPPGQNKMGCLDLEGDLDRLSGLPRATWAWGRRGS